MYKEAALNSCEENENSSLDQIEKNKKYDQTSNKKYEFHIAEKCKENPGIFKLHRQQKENKTIDRPPTY